MSLVEGCGEKGKVGRSKKAREGGSWGKKGGLRGNGLKVRGKWKGKGREGRKVKGKIGIKERGEKGGRGKEREERREEKGREKEGKSCSAMLASRQE